MKVQIEKGIAKGKVLAVPSKSYTHRYLLNAFITLKKSVIKNVLFSQDVLASLDGIRKFEKNIKITNTKTDCVKNVVIKDKRHKKWNFDHILINCQDSASTLRFYLPVCLAIFYSCSFACSKRLIERGIDEYLKICEQNNITYEIKDNIIKFKGSLQPGDYVIDGSKSSQFTTGMLYALSILDGPSTLVVENMVSKNYIDMTIKAMEKAKVKVERISENKFNFPGNSDFLGAFYKVEGDYSNASPMLALNYLDGNIKVKGLNKKSLQGDKKVTDYLEILNNQNAVIDLTNCIDLGPVLMCFAGLKHGATFIGTNNLKIKESNRIEAIKEELAKLNIKVIEEDNKVIIDNTNIDLHPVDFDSHNDHRIVMGLSIILTKTGGSINDITCINKSYPNFFNDLKKLNINLTYIDE